MEFELNGQTYRTGKIDARSQFHIVRRLAPVLGEIAPAAAGGKMGGLDALPPLANAIAKLSDADADYCLFGLLAVVSRKQPQGTGWGPVSTGNTLMYADIDMVGMLQHPQLMPIYDAGEEDGHCYVVTEYVHGARTLAAFCRPDVFEVCCPF